jgi:D-arginine dehydrogenase
MTGCDLDSRFTDGIMFGPGTGKFPNRKRCRKDALNCWSKSYMGNDRIIIIGSGIAGAATAYFLTRRGAHNIDLVEKDKIAGAQSTGRNAAILRTLIPEPEINRLAHESADFYHNPPDGFCERPLVDSVGVYLAARAEHVPTLDKWCDNNPDAKLERVHSQPIYDKIPFLAPGLEKAAYSASDGILDVHTIFQGFLRGATKAGARLHLNCEFKSLRVHNGEVRGVETSDGFMEASKVVVANGAWASVSGTFSGYDLPFAPFRRHLLVTEPLKQVDPRWPVIWIVGEEFYFRPESGGLLMSGCDTVKVTPEQGEIVEQVQLERIAAKAAFWLPSLADAKVARAWSGMRTFATDDMFTIGRDPRAQGLYWVAGLGGHGITCAPVVGKIAADCILDGKSDHPTASGMAPNRLLG